MRWLGTETEWIEVFATAIFHRGLSYYRAMQMIRLSALLPGRTDDAVRHKLQFAVRRLRWKTEKSLRSVGR